MNECVMLKWFLIFIGGGSGAVMRYWVANIGSASLGLYGFWTTAFINITGSFAIGLVSGFIQRTPFASQEIKWLIIIGFLGGYTTFSTYSFEVMQLWQKGAVSSALLYTVISVLLSVVGSAMGYRIIVH